MKQFVSFFLVCTLFFGAGCTSTKGEKPLPHLEERGAATQLIVDGEPFLILGGELWNSAASSPHYMAGMWERLAAVGLNTVLTPVYWELIEPQQGHFDFATLDFAIESARKNNLRLVLLWFGSWKNSMSCYVPGWAKEGFGTKYPLVRTEDGRTLEILTPFAEENMQIDRAAFTALMRHLREVDTAQQTVIMVQVENEIGMIGSARDFSPAANAAYVDVVPPEVVDYLVTRGELCHPHLYNHWRAMGSPVEGSWEALFGVGIDTEEIFMAYHYAKYVEQIAAAGRAEYNLPMYVNAALNSRGRKAGEYPSAGPLAHLWDVWHVAAPSIDFIAPDIYDPLYPDWLAKYDLPGNPLFIPEIQYEPSPTNGARVFYAVGEHKGIGFSPYAVDDAREEADYPLTRAYAILQGLTPLITKHQAAGTIRGVWFDKDNREKVITMNGVDFVCRHDLTLGWGPEAKDPTKWSETAALIIDLGGDEYLVAGTGVVVTMRCRDASEGIVGISRIDELLFADDGSMSQGRRLNGDEDHQGRHLRIPFGRFGAQRLKTYNYK